MPGMIFLRAGTLHGGAELRPLLHIPTRRKQDRITLPAGGPAFPHHPKEFADGTPPA